MRIKGLSLALFALLISFAAGCATAAPGSTAIVESDEEMVKGCKFLGDVYGSTTIGGVAHQMAVNDAKVDAKNKAVKMGATHLVFRVLDGGDMNNTGHVEARAYLCGG